MPSSGGKVCAFSYKIHFSDMVSVLEPETGPYYTYVGLVLIQSAKITIFITANPIAASDLL